MDETERPRFRFGVQIINLSDPELSGLAKVVARKKAVHPHFCKLLEQMIDAEYVRRSKPGQEPECFPVPSMTPAQMGDCVMGAYVFPRLAWTERQAKFVDDVAIHLSALIATVLQAASEPEGSQDEQQIHDD